MRVVATGNIYLDLNLFGINSNGVNILPEIEHYGNHYQASLGGSAVIAPTILSKLGINSTFIGSIGDDEIGNIVRSKLIAAKVHPELVTIPDTQTNISINLLDELGNTYIIISGSANQNQDPNAVAAKLGALQETVDMLYIGGAFKLEYLFSTLISQAKNYHLAGKAVFLDHGRVPHQLTPESRYAFLQQILPHVTYYAPSEEDILNAWDGQKPEQIISRYPHLIIHLKLGPKGSILYTHDGVFECATQVAVGQLNLVGAGDSSNAGFIYAICKNHGAVQAAKIANQVAYLHVTRQEISQDKII